MARVKVDQLTVMYGGVTAVDGVSFDVEEGQFVALLGPSGCGKTTSLRAIAGLEPVSGGRIVIGDRTVAEGKRQLSPDKRGVNMVFQSYAIWPHLTVFENVAYGLKVRSEKKDDIKRAVMDILDVVGLAEYRGRYGTELSGGQQQRVAVARAVVTEPDVLLFDEPLSNLDAALRTRMRVELRDLQQSIGKTAIYVTHDQQEAMAIADKIILMSQGRIEQEGTGEDLYARPRTAFAAEFIGAANLWAGRIADLVADRGYRVKLDDGRVCTTSFGGRDDLQRDQRVLVVARPEDFEVPVGTADVEVGENAWPATVADRTYLGNQVEMVVDVGPTAVRIQANPYTAARRGDQVILRVDANRLVCVPEVVTTGTAVVSGDDSGELSGETVRSGVAR